MRKLAAEFTRLTRKEIAKQSSYCCMGCGKTVIVLDQDGDECLRAQVAHIAPASTNRADPRLDHRIAPARLRSPVNGMLLCGDCHGTGKSPSDKWSTAKCHALKGTAMVAELAYGPEGRVLRLKREGFLDDFVALFSQPTLSCEFTSTNSLRELLRGAPNPSMLLRQLAGYVGSYFSDNSGAKAVAATLMVTMSDKWVPDRSSLDDLSKFACRRVNAERGELLPILEPLTNALSRKGKPNAHRNLLKMTIVDGDWARHRLEHDLNYHGVRLVAGWKRHISDTTHRKGLARADDLPAILEWLRTSDLLPGDRKSIESLLRASFVALQQGGESELIVAAHSRYPSIALTK